MSIHCSIFLGNKVASILTMASRSLTLFFTLSLLIIFGQAKAEESDAETVYKVTLGLVDQSGSEALSMELKANYEKIFGKTYFFLDEAEKAPFKFAPELSYSITRLELDDEESRTQNITFTFFSITWDRENVDFYIRTKLGIQEIKTTEENGEITREENRVVVWNPGLEMPFVGDAKFTWDYELSQQNLFADKTQHKSTLKLVFEF